MNSQRWILPASWAWTKISDIAQVVGGGTPVSTDATNFAEDGIPWITPADLTGYEHAYISKGRRDLSQKGYLSCGARLMPKGSVLFSSRAPIGYCVIAAEELCTNQGFKSLVLREAVLPEFVRYYLLSAKDYAESLAGGTTFLELSGSRMASMQIPVAPIAEQRRTIDILDGFFERVAKSRAELVNIPALIHRYRSSLLQAAYSGALIGSINAPRRSLGEVAQDLRYGTSRKSHTERRGIGVLRIPNVDGGAIDLTDLKYSELDEQEYARLQLSVGDLLVVRSNGSPDLVGRPAVVGEESAGMAYAGYLIRIRLRTQVINPHYLAYMMQAPQCRSQIEAEATSTSGVHNVNAKQLAALTIPVPRMEQQTEIVERLNTALIWLRRAETETIRALDRLVHWRAALLSKAFRSRREESLQQGEQNEALLTAICQSAIPKMPQLLVSEQLENLMAEAPHDHILKDSLDWPSSGLTFEDVAKRVSIEHDQMRDAIFSLLGGDAPELVQAFDAAAGRILLKRNPK